MHGIFFCWFFMTKVNKSNHDLVAVQLQNALFSHHSIEINKFVHS